MTVHLARNRLDRDMAVRGLTQRDLARISGVGEATISRARHGRPVKPATMLKLRDALDRVPEVPGVADLIAEAERSPA